MRRPAKADLLTALAVRKMKGNAHIAKQWSGKRMRAEGGPKTE